MCPSIHVSHCLEDFSPQTSPSGTNYPMVGVLSMCPPHQFSQFPTSGHLCRPAWTRFFAYLALHGLHTTLHTLPRTSVHLCAPLHTSAHLCAPFRTPLCTSMHPCATFALHFPGLVTLIGPSILTSDPFGYLGQLSPSATGHNAHPWTSVESSPNSVAPIQPIRFSLWACTTHIAIQGPCPAGSPLPKRHIFSLCKFFPLLWVIPGGLRGLGLKGGAVPPGVHPAIPPSPLMFPSTIMGTHTTTFLVCATRVTSPPEVMSSPPAAWRGVCGCCFYEGWRHWLGVGGGVRSTWGSLRPLSSLCSLGKYQN